MKSTPEYISAIAALTKIVEIKQFSILEDYSYLINLPLVQDINNKAKQEIGTDLFAVKDSQSLAKYTDFLNKQIKSDILTTSNAAGVEDEIELLNNAKYISPNVLKKYKTNVVITRGEAIRSDLLKALNLNKPDIISLTRNMEYTQELRISPKTAKVFLTSAKIKIRSKPCIILFVLVENKDTSNIISFDEKLDVASVSLFNETNPRFSSPARLFLQMLDKYGRAFTLGVKTQRFYYNGVIPGVYSFEELDKIFPPRVGANVQGGTRDTPLGMEYYFFYTIDMMRLINDIKKLYFI